MNFGRNIAARVAAVRPTRLARALSTLIAVNGRKYMLPQPNRPVVGVCLDGSDKSYIDAAMAVDAMPQWRNILDRERSRGRQGLVATVMPTFTNPNNISIVTGVEPKVHGICGNYALDEETGAEVMLTDPRYLKCGTILKALQDAGAVVGVITAKDKLLRLLSAGLDPSSALLVSVEKAADPATVASLQRFGIGDVRDIMGGASPPGIYDPSISVYALQLGAAWVAGLSKSPATQGRLVVLYVSTTDYVQHKYAPHAPEAVDFYRDVDSAIGRLDELGCVVGVTADHGMNDKVRYDGRPRVVYLESVLADAGVPARVILPITDPYVVHHGALGSFATVYLDNKADVGRALDVMRAQDGVATALSREVGARGFGLDAAAIGDIVVCGDRDTVLGKSEAYHDLGQLGDMPLRSHGGLDESTVPMMVNRPLGPDHARRLGGGQARNYDLFDMLLNGAIIR